MADWTEELIAPGVRVSYGVNRMLAQSSTPYQKLTLIENEQFGRMLLLDGVTQVTTEDEFVYHEMLAHVPLFAHGDARDVLIVGGGDCGLAEEVLKHEDVRRVFQAELDPAVVSASRRHLSAINAAVFNDERFQLRIDDGLRFVDDLDESFDVVLVDSTDPTGPGAKLFSEDFYRSVRRCLRMRGILAVQAGVPFLQRASFASTMRNLSSVFKYAGCYLLASPSYIGGHLAIGWGSDTLRLDSPSLECLQERFAKSRMNLRYYTPEVHKAAFALPPYIAELAGKTEGRATSQRVASTHSAAASTSHA